MAYALRSVSNAAIAETGSAFALDVLLMFTTYHVPTTGLPSNQRQHVSIAEALAAWRTNCDALSAEGGGMSVLCEDNAGSALVWAEQESGHYVYGELLPHHVPDAKSLDSPDAVAAWVRDYFADEEEPATPLRDTFQNRPLVA